MSLAVFDAALFLNAGKSLTESYGIRSYIRIDFSQMRNPIIRFFKTIHGVELFQEFDSSLQQTHFLPRKHMQKYLVEFEFRFDLRGPQASSMFDRLIQAF